MKRDLPRSNLKLSIFGESYYFTIFLGNNNLDSQGDTMKQAIVE